jgi:hypothetical protein
MTPDQQCVVVLMDRAEYRIVGINALAGGVLGGFATSVKISITVPKIVRPI